MRKSLILFFVIIVTTLFVFPVNAKTNFQGEQIITIPSGDLTLSADEPCYIHIEVVFHDWLSVPGQEKVSLLTAVTVEQSINGEPVQLKQSKSFQRVYELADGTLLYDCMIINFYIQFKANHFEPGPYEFESVVKWEGSVILEGSAYVYFE